MSHISGHNNATLPAKVYSHKFDGEPHLFGIYFSPVVIRVIKNMKLRTTEFALSGDGLLDASCSNCASSECLPFLF